MTPMYNKDMSEQLNTRRGDAHTHAQRIPEREDFSNDNTVESLQKIQGATLEYDAMLTADGDIVVLHNRDFNPLFNAGEGLTKDGIAEKTTEQLQDLRRQLLDERGLESEENSRILTLKEVLEMSWKSGNDQIIELKPAGPDDAEKMAEKFVEQYHAAKENYTKNLGYAYAEKEDEKSPYSSPILEHRAPEYALNENGERIYEGDNPMRILAHSFNPGVLRHIHTLDPDVPISLNWTSTYAGRYDNAAKYKNVDPLAEAGIKYDKDDKSSWIHAGLDLAIQSGWQIFSVPQWDIVDQAAQDLNDLGKRLLERTQEHNVRLSTWMVNDKDDPQGILRERLLSYGIDVASESYSPSELTKLHKKAALMKAGKYTAENAARLGEYIPQTKAWANHLDKQS
jgi:Glycerophosphoryl diester phosphodiesterase